jgi:hypothetical protein
VPTGHYNTHAESAKEPACSARCKTTCISKLRNSPSLRLSILSMFNLSKAFQMMNAVIRTAFLSLIGLLLIGHVSSMIIQNILERRMQRVLDAIDGQDTSVVINISDDRAELLAQVKSIPKQRRTSSLIDSGPFDLSFQFFVGDEKSRFVISVYKDDADRLVVYSIRAP